MVVNTITVSVPGSTVSSKTIEVVEPNVNVIGLSLSGTRVRPGVGITATIDLENTGSDARDVAKSITLSAGGVSKDFSLGTPLAPGDVGSIDVAIRIDNQGNVSGLDAV